MAATGFVRAISGSAAAGAGFVSSISGSVMAATGFVSSILHALAGDWQRDPGWVRFIDFEGDVHCSTSHHPWLRSLTHPERHPNDETSLKYRNLESSHRSPPAICGGGRSRDGVRGAGTGNLRRGREPEDAVGSMLVRLRGGHRPPRIATMAGKRDRPDRFPDGSLVTGPPSVESGRARPPNITMPQL
jgi:hypothetical protein